MELLKFEIVMILVLFIGCTTNVNGKGFDANGEKKVDDKLRLCFVEARGTYKKAGAYCPTLEAKSNIECVIGSDRLDCLRRISKGTAHFGVFSPEDLIAAKLAGIELLVTSEMRFNNDSFQYEVVAVVANDAQINSVNDLRGSRFCHPGHGLDSHWTVVLADYFESTMVARNCEDDLTATESRIKASATFLGPSCKAGPWVPDPKQDAILKKRYPSLCEKCYNPSRCSQSDKYWGRMGPIYCLTSGDGEVAWVRLDDIRTHFGLFNGLQADSDPNLYSYLCPDGHLQPLHTESPCIWVAEPWPAVAAKREYAKTVQSLLEELNHYTDDSWQSALLSLLETYHVNLKQLDTTVPIGDYLEQAVGFTSAYSFPSCNPSRSIVYCTTSLIELSKCSWLQEVASVYGIEPNIQCVRTNSLDECMEETQHRATDVILVGQNDRIRAERMYHLKPILYEYAKNLSNRYTVLAVVKTDSEIYNFQDLRKKRVCLPSFEGAAYLSALETVRHYHKHLYTLGDDMKFFAENSCIWGPGSSGNCSKKYFGDEGALRCLADNRGDVAFVEMSVFQKFIGNALNSAWSRDVNPSTYKLICPFGRCKKPDELCYVHWASRGQLMISNQTNLMRRNEIYNSFRDMDRLFGKFYESHILPFSIYGPFDRQENVLFHDQTDALRGVFEMRRDRMPRLLEDTFGNYTAAVQQYGDTNSAMVFGCNFMCIILALLALILINEL